MRGNRVLNKKKQEDRERGGGYIYILYYIDIKREKENWLITGVNPVIVIEKY